MKEKTEQQNQYWLMKSEPETYSIKNLEKDQKTWWEGVRNYQARNFMTQSMRIGDLVLFYHSNAEPSGVAGLAVVCAGSQPDKLQFEKKSDFFEPRATKDNPVWHCVQVQFQEVFLHFISLEQLKNHPGLKDLMVIKKGQRLSIQPVSAADFELICQMGRFSK